MSTPSRVGFNVFIDSDGVVADFDTDLQKSGLDVYDFKHKAGSYLWLPVMAGASEALEVLKQFDDKNELRVWIATKTPNHAPYSYTEKVLWYRRHFPWLENRVIVIHDKSQLGSEDDVLVDDRPHKGNVEHFRGTHLHFGSATCPDWQAALVEILNLKCRVS